MLYIFADLSPRNLFDEFAYWYTGVHLDLHGVITIDKALVNLFSIQQDGTLVCIQVIF